MKLPKLIWFLAIGAAQTACAAEPDSAVIPAKPTDTCVFYSALYDWQILDNSNLVVWVPGTDDAYHLVLAMPLSGLRSAFKLGFVDGTNDGRLCNFGQDAITVGENSRQQRSTIQTIERLNDATLAKLQELYTVRLAPQSKRKAPPKTPDRTTAQ